MKIQNAEIPTSAYLHIPFCRRRCYYCDFAVSVVGDRKHGENSVQIQQYVEVLCQEINQAPVWHKPLDTIFLGGGTPSLLSVSQLSRIIETLNQRFGIATDAEISIEMDPGTFDDQKLQGFSQAGVNRVSLGVQAFQDELLHQCGRSHTVTDIETAVDLLHQVGVSNFSIDLISGLPHQTIEMWQHSLEMALEIAPPHLSHYDLIVEPKTVFGRYYTPGEDPLPSDEMTAEMYRLAQKTLTEAGYNHYEVSNYAQAGSQCRHNLVYWKTRPYYGFGMGAASYLEGYRLTRPRQTQLYYQWVHSSNPLENAEWVNTTQEILLETLMLGLRLAEGLSLTLLSQQFGSLIVEQILSSLRPYQEKGWVEILTPSEEIQSQDLSGNSAISGILRLSDPEGFLFSNTVLATLWSDLSDFAFLTQNS